MPDFLTSYAESQPDKPAVIDDRGSGEPVRWTYRELEERSNRLAHALASLGVGPGEKVIWCGPNSPQVVAAIGATRKIGAVSVPLNYRLTADEARYVIAHSDASVAYVDAEHAPMFAALRGSLDRLRQVIVYGGARARRDARRGVRGRGVGGSAPGPRGRERLGDHDLHVRDHGQAQGRGADRPRRGRRHAHRAHRADRLHAGRRLPDLRPAVPQRPVGVHERCPGPGADGRAAAQVRPGGLAPPGGHLPGLVHLRRARADPDGVRPAGRGEGALRPVVHEAHDRQRRAVELRAEAAVPGRLPRGLAVGGVRVDRAGRGLRPGARGPAAQAGLVRQAGARGGDPAVRRGGQRGHRHRARPSGRAVRAVDRHLRRVLQATRTATTRPGAATSTPSGTSPTATRRATSTSATARPT